jgi:hypothetical protein
MKIIEINGVRCVTRKRARRLVSRRVEAAMKNAQNPPFMLKYLNPRRKRTELAKAVTAP